MKAWVVTVLMGVIWASSGQAAESVPLNDREKASHALNRLGYGPRPGEVDKVADLGVEKWIRAQLDPEKIKDDQAESMVAELTYIQKSPQELMKAFEAEVRARRELNRARAAEGKAAEDAKMAKEGSAMMSDEKMAETPVEETGKPSAKAAPPRRLQRPGVPDENELVVAQALGELQHAKLTRAVYSERQLEQVLVDFWFNHFNVDARKQQVRAMVVSYEQDVIRPHIWGSFRDLLAATAKSPAMLVYLDNWRSSVAYEPGEAETRIARRLQRNATGMSAEEAAALPKPTRGLNENYGRELMELHTLGVDGGYTQKDVQEVARALTGWTTIPLQAKFQFRPQWHDQGEKVILGKTFPANGGQKDGEQVLDLLANHPATAHHIAYQLCQRFVADKPPEDLVKRVAAVFLSSGGNLRATYEALFLDKAFFAPEYYGAKTKSPFEFIASSLRASGAELVEVTGVAPRLPLRALEAGALLGRGQERMSRLPRKTLTIHLVEMGQSNYGWGPPTGFPEDSSTWVSSGALVSRLNYALALTGGQVADARVHVRTLLAGKDADMAEEAVDSVARNLFARPLSDSTRRVVLAQSGADATEKTGGMPPPVADLPKVLALILGAPEFQRR
ncbi:MAG: hypothetical protein RIQ79_26 [Verrucomicrobiota bacterium]